jgi:hypothetical protein
MTIVFTVLVVLAILTPVIRALANGKRDLKEIALSFAEGVDNAKAYLPSDYKVVTAAMRLAADDRGVHDKVVAFLQANGLNRPKPIDVPPQAPPV